MTVSSPKATWSSIKATLQSFEHAELLKTIQDLYALSADNKNFLHTRFSLGEDNLEPYKKVIKRWIYPNFNQEISIAKAKKAISDYKKAIGKPNDLVELQVFYCEQAMLFCTEYGYGEERYFMAVESRFEEALKTIPTLAASQKSNFLMRLDNVRKMSDDFGWGVYDELNHLWEQYGQSI